MTKLLRPSDLYPVVYGFLSKCGHKSAMKAFLKDTELNKSQLKTEEDLLEMIASYKILTNKLPRKQSKPAATVEDSDDTENDDDDDDEDDENDNDHDDDEVGEEESDSDESEDEAVLQQRLKLLEKNRKRKAEDAAKAAEEWVKRASTSPAAAGDKKAKTNREPRVSGEAFKRVDPEIWSKEIVQGLEDNSYERQFGEDGYGAKASAVLKQVRGKDFRHEKTKKKRGSYRGGNITLASNSFKYDD